jgi:hypothetical protein
MRSQPMPQREVLIVDDEASVRDVLAGILQDSGYKVDQAGTVADVNGHRSFRRSGHLKFPRLAGRTAAPFWGGRRVEG